MFLQRPGAIQQHTPNLNMLSVEHIFEMEILKAWLDTPIKIGGTIPLNQWTQESAILHNSIL